MRYEEVYVAQAIRGHFPTDILMSLIVVVGKIDNVSSIDWEGQFFIVPDIQDNVLKIEMSPLMVRQAFETFSEMSGNWFRPYI